MNENHILITGATSSLGRKLYPHLLAKGYELTLFTRNIPCKAAQWEDLQALSKKFPTQVHVQAWDLMRPATYRDNVRGYDQLIDLLPVPFFKKKAEYEEYLQARFYFWAELLENGLQTIFLFRPFIGEKDYQKSLHQAAILEMERKLQYSGSRFRILSLAPLIGKDIPFWEKIVAYTRSHHLIFYPAWMIEPRQFLYHNDFTETIIALLAHIEGWGFKAALANPGEMSLIEMMKNIAKYQKHRIVFIPIPFTKQKQVWVSEKTRDIKKRIAKLWKTIVYKLKKWLIYLTEPGIFSDKNFASSLRHWENIENSGALFTEINHFPANYERIFKDYFIRLF